MLGDEVVWRVRTKRNRGNEDHDRDAHAHGWIGVKSTAVVGEPDYCGSDDDAQVVCAIADDVDEDARHGEVALRFARGVLGIGVVFVVFVLHFRLVRSDSLRRQNGAHLSIYESDCVLILVWRCFL